MQKAEKKSPLRYRRLSASNVWHGVSGMHKCRKDTLFALKEGPYSQGRIACMGQIYKDDVGKEIDASIQSTGALRTETAEHRKREQNEKTVNYNN